MIAKSGNRLSEKDHEALGVIVDKYIDVAPIPRLSARGRSEQVKRGRPKRSNDGGAS
jgi:hypothetical protein